MLNPLEADSYLEDFKAKVFSEDDPSFLQNSRVAEMYMAVGKVIQSLEFFEAAVKAFQSDDIDREIYGRVYLKTLGQYASALDETGDFVTCEKMYNTILDIDPNNHVLGDFAYFLHRRKRAYDEAERYFKKSISLFPKHASVHLKYAGFLRHARKDTDRATKHYREAIEVNPTYADALGSFASFLHSTQHADKSMIESLYQRAVDADKTHVNNYCNYGLYLSEEVGKFEKAEDMYKQALEVSPSHANTLYNYAVLLDSHLKRKDIAESLYRRCLDSQPRHAFALYNLAVLREELVSNLIYESALAKNKLKGMENSESPEEKEKYEELNSNVLSDEKERDLLKEVCELYERSVEADSRDFTALADCGRFLCEKLREYVRGEQFLLGALNLNPHCETALLHMGVLEYIHRSSFDKSRKYFDKVLEINPKNISCMHHMARMVVQSYTSQNESNSKGGNYRTLDEAFRLYETIIQVAVDPSPYASEYLTQVINNGSLKQKLGATAFVESNKNLYGHQSDFQQLLSLIKK